MCSTEGKKQIAVAVAEHYVIILSALEVLAVTVTVKKQLHKTRSNEDSRC